ncbi:MAG: acetolactate synthase large subunit [Bacillaceae bacterium]|nr:acetolactate synthase large subunit [Bacillaceae bacterium]
MKTKVKEEVAEKSSSKKMNGAMMLVEALKEEGVEVIFGYPGGAVLPIYDKLYDAGIKHILTRHEQGGIHAAEGYARISGKPGVCIVTSGPGATNVVTGLTDAMMDSLPLVVFTGQVASGVIGSDAFQEADVIGITMPVTKHSYQVRDVNELPKIIKEAFHIATTGRPGPVLIDIPKDISNAEGIFDYSEEVNISSYQPTTKPNHLQIRKLVEAVSCSKKPVILAGAGVIHARANKELKTYAEQQQIPVVHTLLGLGGMPGDHELYFGMAGMHGCYTANMALYECDLLISIGARFDDRVTGNLKHFAPNAKVAHIDIDPAEIGKNVPTEIPVVGDAREALTALIEENGKPGHTSEWLARLQNYQREYPLTYKRDPQVVKPQRLIEMVHEQTRGDAIITTDVGQHQMWAAQYYGFKNPNRWVTSGGLGTMGFGLPSAIGAQLADEKATVVAILGDGGFQMTSQELTVLAQLKLPIKVIVMNNHSLGMVRQWQEIFYEKRYSHSLIPDQPDMMKLADAYGIKGFKARNEEEASEVLKEALNYDGPVLINVVIPGEEKVYPMVPPGKGNHEMVGVKP